MPIPAALTANLLVDTGASHTVIDRNIINSLNLPVRGVLPTHTPTTGANPVMVNQFDVDIAITGQNGQSITFPNWLVTESDLSAQGIQGLIGRDILAAFRMTYSGPERLLLLSA